MMILRQIRPLAYKRLSVAPRNVSRTLIAAPKPNSGPLMTRRSDRDLPGLSASNRWMRTIPVFVLILTGCSLAIFNYQKLNSSVVASTLYALRTNDTARELLGDEIYFASKVPWIWGTINQLHGQIDITFGVSGKTGRADMKFVSERRGRMGLFQTKEWSLKMPDGRVVQLLNKGGVDPSKHESESLAAEA